MTFSTFLHRSLIGLLALTFVVGLGVPWATAQEGDEARTIVDVMGREVILEAPPQRVIGMSASIIDLLFAVGVPPVGVTEGIEHPAAADLPTFGTGYQPDLEALAALEPDLIIANAQLQAPIMDQLEAIAPTVFVLFMTAEDIPTMTRLIGQATWHDTPAGYLAQAYDAVLAAWQTNAPDDGPSILIIVGVLGAPNFGKSDTYLGHMASLLGATNIADGNEDAGPFPGYTQLDIEYILAEDPDVILTITRGPPGATPIPEEMADDPFWSALSAFENGRVYEIDNRLYLEAPGPRFTEAIQRLYGILYGED